MRGTHPDRPMIAHVFGCTQVLFCRIRHTAVPQRLRKIIVILRSSWEVVVRWHHRGAYFRCADYDSALPRASYFNSCGVSAMAPSRRVLSLRCADCDGFAWCVLIFRCILAIQMMARLVACSFGARATMIALPDASPYFNDFGNND